MAFGILLRIRGKNHLLRKSGGFSDRPACGNRRGLHCATRYDTAHGYAHRDVLRFDGSVLRKEPMQENDFDLAFDAAYADICSNHERHIAAFLATRPE